MKTAREILNLLGIDLEKSMIEEMKLAIDRLFEPTPYNRLHQLTDSDKPAVDEAFILMDRAIAKKKAADEAVLGWLTPSENGRRWAEECAKDIANAIADEGE